MIENAKEESENFHELARLEAEAGIDEFYHYDTPLTKEHETSALLSGGFSKVEYIHKWGNTVMLKAYK